MTFQGKNAAMKLLLAKSETLERKQGIFHWLTLIRMFWWQSFS